MALLMYFCQTTQSNDAQFLAMVSAVKNYETSCSPALICSNQHYQAQYHGCYISQSNRVWFVLNNVLCRFNISKAGNSTSPQDHIILVYISDKLYIQLILWLYR